MPAAEEEVKLILKHGGPATMEEKSERELAAAFAEMQKDVEWLRVVVVVATAAIWLILIGASLSYLLRDSVPQEKFVDLATKVMLPLYQSTIAVVLTYVFGKPVSKAIVRRLQRV